MDSSPPRSFVHKISQARILELGAISFSNVEYHSVIKKNKIKPLAATQMQLEMIILSKSERESQIPYDITYMWNIKYDTNEPIYMAHKVQTGGVCFLPRGRKQRAGL